MSKVPIKIEYIEIYYDAFGKCTPEWLEQAPTSCNLQGVWLPLLCIGIGKPPLFSFYLV